MSTNEDRPPLPPFTEESAKQKVQAAEDAWNSRDPDRVVLAYTPGTIWRNRTIFLEGRDQVHAFLNDKWKHEQDYRLKKTLWCHCGDRISVAFEYEYHDQNDQWHRAYGNELWKFAPNGLMHRREASINDVMIDESERKLRWDR